ncbi:hypothetical protein F4859DRAFT_529192 [Xylaria cf. heliscus]|nr:hypothetical protein F4859DRAFT_529192 [Xylaria cf. heliscus]
MKFMICSKTNLSLRSFAMSGSRKNALPVDISHLQVKPSGSDIVKLDDEINTIARVIAETHIDTPSSNATLTTNGYANKAILRDALVEIGSNDEGRILRYMLRDGAYIYKAVYQQEIVGVVIIIRLVKEFAPSTSSPKTPSPVDVPLPNPSDLEAVELYAISDVKDEESRLQLRDHLNSHLRYYGIGKLWELSSLGVKEGFRHREIGRKLVKHALSRVPKGNKVIIQAEPDKEAMYQHLGFQSARSKPHTVDSVTIEPEWEKKGNHITLPMMIFHKGDNDELSKEEKVEHPGAVGYGVPH